MVTNIRALGKSNNILSSVRLSLFCGEALNQQDVLFWEKLAPNSLIENLYGPTEVTVACFRYRWITNSSINECRQGIVPIGKIFKNLTSVILKENFKEADHEEVGELCIAGPQVFSGYITSQQDPFVEISGSRYYRTGDLVYRTKNGNTIYVSRTGSPCKVGEYKVELSEIEYIIKSIQNVIEAIVLLEDKDNQVKTLTAFVKAINLTDADILKVLKQKLPEYMVPSKIYIIENIPLNYNGKIDRAKLSKFLND
jgi:acyl-coenzyme A synthetase/AMP-(fatty) acid ligase